MSVLRIILITFCFPVFLFSSDAIKSTEESINYINRINGIIKKYKDAGEKLTDRDVKEAILKEVSEFIPLNPGSGAESMNMDAIKSKVMQEVAIKFPAKYENMKKKISEDADKKFRMSNVMEFISVKYLKGDNLYTAKGLFYGIKPERNGVKIGETIYPIVDLVPEDRVKFDKTFCEIKKKQYIDEEIGKYYQKKQEYTAEVRKQITDQISKKNEKAGYIYAWDKWRTAKDVTEILISELMKDQGIVTIPQPEPSAVPAIVESTETTVAKLGDALEKRKTELEKKVDMELMRVANTFSGIDADQGYKRAMWWMKGEDINLLFPDFKPDDKSNPKIIKNPNPITDSVELYFFNDYLFRVVIKYKIASSTDAMVELAKKIRDDYGPSDEEKKAEKAEETPPPSSSTTPETETTAEVPEEESSEIPLEETYVWKGKITKGTLIIRRSEDGKSLTEFTFIKENPEVVEKISSALEKEKKRKEEEEKKKEFEMYKKYKNDKL